MDKFFSVFGKLVLILILFAGIAGAAFYFGKKYSPSQPSQSSQFTQPTSSPTSYPTSSPSATSSPTNFPSPTPIIKKIISAGVASGLSFSLYTIAVPTDWAVAKEHSDSTPPLDKLTLTKSGYELSIYQAATGGALCIYPGVTPPEGPSSIFSSYVEFAGADGKIYRRGEATGASSGGKKTLTVCQKSEDSFGQPTGFGHISYKIPVSFDEGILKEMDGMVVSLSKK